MGRGSQIFSLKLPSIGEVKMQAVAGLSRGELVRVRGRLEAPFDLRVGPCDLAVTRPGSSRSLAGPAFVRLARVI